MPASEYEIRAREQIWQWKNPKKSWFDKVSDVVSWPLDRAGEVLMDNRFGEAVSKSMMGAISVLNDVSQRSNDPEPILNRYRRLADSPVNRLRDIHTLDLEVVDQAIGWLDSKYKGIALVEGGLAGGAAVGGPLVALAVIPSDVTALLGLNLRAIGAYATYCGFDLSSPEERLFAMNVLALASSPSDTAKQAALAQLVRIAREVALRHTWKQLEGHVTVTAIQQIAKSLSIRLTKAKLAQTIPALGAAIGGGFNAYFTDKVCTAAFYLYRERFLAEKYGVDEIEITVEPAESPIPEFDDGSDPPLVITEAELPDGPSQEGSRAKSVDGSQGFDESPKTD